MKTKKTFVYCEYCNKAWEDISPPSNDQYESGVIKIQEYSTLLLPKKIAKKGGHSKDINGVKNDLVIVKEKVGNIENFIFQQQNPRIKEVEKRLYNLEEILMVDR